MFFYSIRFKTIILESLLFISLIIFSVFPIGIFAETFEKLEIQKFYIQDVKEVYDLKGDWGFTLDTVKEISDPNTNFSDWQLLPVPGYWRNHSFLGTKKAWYKTKIFISQNFQSLDLGLISPGFLGAQEIYLNGHFIGNTGIMDDQKELVLFSARPDVFLIPSEYVKLGENNFIQIRVADNLNMGGFPDRFRIGEYSAAKFFFIKRIIFKSGIAITYLIFSLYFFIMYFENKSEKVYFLFFLVMFGFFCFVISLDRIVFWFTDNFYIYYYLISISITILSPLYLLLPVKAYDILLSKFDKWLLSTSIPFILISLILGMGMNPDLLKFRNVYFMKIQPAWYWLYIIIYIKVFYEIIKRKLYGYQIITLGFVLLISNAILLTLNQYNIFILKDWYFGEINLIIIGSISFTISRKFRDTQMSLVKLEKSYHQDLINEVELKTKELSDVNRELMKSNLTKDKLFSIISHDLRNPLVLLNEVIKLVNRKELKETTFRKHIRNLSDHLDRNRSLLENLLNWSSTQLYDIQPNRELVDLDEIVSLSIKNYEVEARRKKIKIEIHPIKPCIVYTDKNMILIIINNLLNNAIKFSPKNSSVVIKMENDINYYILSIQDSGPGIDAETLRHLFTISRLKESSSRESQKGSGLGLVVVKDLIDRLGDQIFYKKSEEGSGIFSFTVQKWK